MRWFPATVISVAGHAALDVSVSLGFNIYTTRRVLIIPLIDVLADGIPPDVKSAMRSDLMSLRNSRVLVYGNENNADNPWLARVFALTACHGAPATRIDGFKADVWDAGDAILRKYRLTPRNIEEVSR